MDIQKEREAFEAKSPFSIYIDKVERDGERYKPVHYKDLDYAQIMSFGWLAWQAAKAQKVAVPEGFVLVPRKATKHQIDKAIHDLNLSGGTDILVDIYKAMIEAQEQNNA